MVSVTVRQLVAVVCLGLGPGCHFDSSGLQIALPVDTGAAVDGRIINDGPQVEDLAPETTPADTAPLDVSADLLAVDASVDGPARDTTADGAADGPPDGPPACTGPVTLALVSFEEAQIPGDWVLQNIAGLGLAVLFTNSAFDGAQSLRLEAITGDCDSDNPGQTEFRLAFPLLQLPAGCTTVHVQLRFRNINHEYWEGDELWLDARNESGDWTAQADIAAINTDRDRPSVWLAFDEAVAVIEDFQLGLRHVSQCTDAVLIDQLRVIASP
jgi:hypothetical protein